MKKHRYLLLILATVAHIGFISKLCLAEPKLRVFRGGVGEVGMAYPWKEGYRIQSLHADKKYHPKRIRPGVDYAPAPPAILQSWSSENFTSLKGVIAGTTLEEFRLVVHGLEIQGLVDGISNMSFDGFVHKWLNVKAPMGPQFVRYYPYFFHKKTIISASVVTQNLTATFGRYGFTLGVPAENYIGCSRVDMHTPTDMDFYEKVLGTFEFGYTSVKALPSRYPMVNIAEFLPSSPVVIGEEPYRKSEIRSSEAEFEQGLGLHLAEMMGGLLAPDKRALFEQPFKPESWYNEVAINPVAVYPGEAQGRQVRINGIFFRATDEDIAAILAEPAMQELLNLAEVYDLPIVQILDSRFYATDL